MTHPFRIGPVASSIALVLYLSFAGEASGALIRSDFAHRAFLDPRERRVRARGLQL